MIENYDEYKALNAITDEVIVNLKRIVFATISEEDIVDFIHWHCQKVLQIAKEKNNSKEVARAINLNTYEVLGTVMGDQRRVDIDVLVRQMKNTGHIFIVIHNHPSDMHFSMVDIKTFINADNMTILIVLGNNGSVYILEKTKQLALNEIMSVRKVLINWKNGLLDFEEVIEHIKAFGIIYNEM